jgi:hypothetical protein
VLDLVTGRQTGENLSRGREERLRDSSLSNVAETGRDQQSTPLEQSRVLSAVARLRAAAHVFEEWQTNERDADASRAWSKLEAEKSRTTVARRETGIANDISRLSTPASAKTRSIVYEPSFSSDTNPLAANEEATNNFASVERTAASLIDSWTNAGRKVSGSAWPSLPAEPTVNLADELAAVECEGEITRRLDHEQRGTLWNA